MGMSSKFLRIGSLHIGSSDPTYVQNFRSVSLMVFEILGFNLICQNVCSLRVNNNNALP